MPAENTSRFPAATSQPQRARQPEGASQPLTAAQSQMGLASARPGAARASDSHPKRLGRAPFVRTTQAEGKPLARSIRAQGKPFASRVRRAAQDKREEIAPTLFPMVLPQDQVPSNRDCAASHGMSGASQPPLDASQPPDLATPRSGKPAELVGIARLAASSPLAGEKRSTEYFLLPVRSILNRCDSARMPFEWTINPYRGCEFGCKYCYARYTHEFMELDGAEFEKKIFAKQNAGALIARDLLEKLDPRGSLGAPPEQIAIGTATDPYQPAEREFGVTREILERLAEQQGLSLSITTKSDQVVRDVDLLRRISERSSLAVNVSITTPRPRLARMLEPRAPRPDLRFAAVRKLREAGIHAGVFVMPILPGLTDREADLERLAQMAVEARAEWFSGGVLWLMQSAARHLLPFIEEKFPRLAADYRKWYTRSAYAPEDYRRMVGARVAALRKKYKLGYRPYAESPAERPAAASPQLALALGPVSHRIGSGIATSSAA